MAVKKFNWPPRNYRKNPLGEWPDQKKHEETKSPQVKSESSDSGHMPDPESDDDIEERTANVGLYEETNPDPKHPEQGPENPHELNIAEEVEEAEKDQWET